MRTIRETLEEIKEGCLPLYVYVLHKPDGTPFYVGRGKVQKRDARVSFHEYEARLLKTHKTNVHQNRLKVNTIRKIWSDGGRVYYHLDSWHITEASACERERSLIAELGRRILKTGPLTNLTEGGEDAERSEQTRQQISATLKKHFSDPANRKADSERLKVHYQNNPQAVERARQNAIKNKSHEKLIEWMQANPQNLEERGEQHGIALKEWYVSHPNEAKALAERRNVILRSDEHRRRMTEATRKYIANNPEADRERRRKAKNVFEAKSKARQGCLWLVHDRLVGLGEIKAIRGETITHKVYAGWKKRGLIQKHFPDIPVGNVSKEKWEHFRSSMEK